MFCEKEIQDWPDREAQADACLQVDALGSNWKGESKMNGFILWYDEKSDDGILCDLSGNQYYFNAWSFPGTKWRVTGKCKKTGRKKTILTRHFPGLFLSHHQRKDFEVHMLRTDMPVVFEQASGIDQPWAVKIKIETGFKAELRVMRYRLSSAMKSLEAAKADPLKHRRKIWVGYQERRIKSYQTGIRKLMRKKTA